MSDERGAPAVRGTPAWWGFGAAGGVVLLLILVSVWRYFSVRESTDDAQVDGHIHPIAARVGGTVLSVNVKDNQLVTAGTVLVQLDPKDYDVAVAKAKADLRDAEAALEAAQTAVPVASTTTESQLSAADSGVATAQARLAAAAAHLVQAEANHVQAARDLERLKQLVAKDEVSRAEYDAAVARADAARGARDAAQADVEAAQKGVEEARAMAAQAKTGPQQVSIMRSRAVSADAKVAERRAALDQALLNREYTAVKAPVGGIVSRKSAELGEIVQGGQPLMAIIPLEDTWITANFKENQLKEMRPGQKALVSVDAYGGRTYTGRVDSIAAATGARFSVLPPENASGNYVKVVQRVPVKIVLDGGQDPDHLLRPGLSVAPTVLVR